MNEDFHERMMRKSFNDNIEATFRNFFTPVIEDKTGGPDVRVGAWGFRVSYENYEKELQIKIIIYRYNPDDQLMSVVTVPYTDEFNKLTQIVYNKLDSTQTALVGGVPVVIGSSANVSEVVEALEFRPRIGNEFVAVSSAFKRSPEIPQSQIPEGCSAKTAKSKAYDLKQAIINVHSICSKQDQTALEKEKEKEKEEVKKLEAYYHGKQVKCYESNGELVRIFDDGSGTQILHFEESKILNETNKRRRTD